MKLISEKIRLSRVLPAVAFIACALILVAGAAYVYAETYPGGEDNGRTSRLKELSSDLATLGHGSTSNDPDWGADWNRIASSSIWVPDGSIAPSDVAAGKTFYNDSRTAQTGTGHFSGPCPTQSWYDSSPNANQTNNCVSSWEVANPAVLGDDKKDPKTGLVWSKCLLNTAGVNNFSGTTSCSTYSWTNASVTNSGRTAKELCVDRGNGWRLPSQKELMQAYIDGSHFNLVTPTTSQSYWSTTEGAVVPTAYIVHLGDGTTNANQQGNSNRIRCVR